VNRVVIIGGSVAGSTVASTLRDLGHDEEILVVDAERHSYARPSLSKAALRGEPVVDAAAHELGITVLREEFAVAHDPERRTVTLAGGDLLPYDNLVIATGSRASRLAPGRDGEFVIRSLSDVETLRAGLARARSVVVVGGGLLGMEIASACRGLGLTVHLVFRSTPGLRSVGDYTARWLAAEAESHGVHLLRIDGPAELVGSPLIGVRTGPDRILAADVVISAVGDVPNVEWTPLGVPGVGMPTNVDGLVAPGVYAVGDAKAIQRSPGSVRDPHWYAAIDGGRMAARAMLGVPVVPPPARYLWTECFGHHLKFAGSPVSGPPTRIEGDPDGAHTAVWERGNRTVFAVATDMRTPVSRLRGRIDSPSYEPERLRS